MRTILACFLLLLAPHNAKAEIFTVLIEGDPFSLTVRTNQVFRVINLGTISGISPGAAQGQAVRWTFSMTNALGGRTFAVNTFAYSESSSTNSQARFAPGNLPEQIAGPFSLTVQNVSLGTGLILTYEILTATPTTQIANTVVIPEDSNGPVQIILEQSTDLISWTAANPGTYGATTQKRFFRLRAVKQ